MTLIFLWVSLEEWTCEAIGFDAVAFQLPAPFGWTLVIFVVLCVIVT
jgi:hypothetical protein